MYTVYALLQFEYEPNSTHITSGLLQKFKNNLAEMTKYVGIKIVEKLCEYLQKISQPLTFKYSNIRLQGPELVVLVRKENKSRLCIYYQATVLLIGQ